MSDMYLKVSVEGNIGCGKSTFLKYFQSCPTAEVLKEPVEKWTDLRGHNALELMYKDPARYKFLFNTYCIMTGLKMHKKEAPVPVKILERSLFSLRYIFVENAHMSNFLTSLEYAVLSEWFDFIFATEKIHVDLFVYLRASPKVCYDRIAVRNRKEESGVPISFIEDLHGLYEDWLMKEKYPVPAPVLVLDASEELKQMEQIYEDHRSEILRGCTA